MATGMGAFVQGLSQGFVTGRKMQQAQEAHDLEVAEREEKQAFKAELKQAGEDLTPSEQFSVTAPDGTIQMFDSQDDALKVMEGGDGFQLSRSFAVGDKTFDNADMAQYAARVANSDVGKMSRQAAVAMKYGQPQMAAQLAAATDQMRASRANALTDMALTYKQSGNIDGLLNMFDQQAGDGAKSRVVEQDGQYMIVRNVGGQDIPVLAQPAGSVGELFDLAAMGFNLNHHNITDIWKFDRTHGLQERQQVERERHNLASEGLSAGNLAVSQARLGIQKMEHEWAAQDRDNPKPDVRYGTDDLGQVVPFTTVQTRQSGSGWSTTTTPGQPLQGVMGRPPREESFTERKLREAEEAANKPRPSLTDGWTPEHSSALGSVLSGIRRPPANSGGTTPAAPAPAAPRNGGLRVPPEVENQVDPYGNLPYGR